MLSNAQDALSEPVLSAVRPLCSDLIALGAEQDEPRELAGVLARSAITGLLIPNAAGGLGGNWLDLLGGATQVARASGSAAWLVTHYAFNAALVGRFGDAVTREVWGNPTPWVAQALRSETAVCKTASGRVVVSGDWRFVTGAAHAQWVLLPVMNPDLVLLVPREALDAADPDHLGGLRGVGFQHLSGSEIEVPTSHVIPRKKLFAAIPEGIAVDGDPPGPVDPYWLNAQLGSVLGCAQGGYEEYREITSQSVGGVAGNQIAKLTQVQSRLGHARAELKTAGLLLNDLASRVGQDNASLLASERSHIARLCLDSIARLVEKMGARGLFDQNPLQRRYRDLRAMVAHDAFDWRRNMASSGRSELGVGD